MDTRIPSNQGGIDRGVRGVVRLALRMMVFVGPKGPWGWVGVVPRLTGALGNCPLDILYGMSTSKTPSRL